MSNSSNIAIKVENLGKKYIIHHEKKESCKTSVLEDGIRKMYEWYLNT